MARNKKTDAPEIPLGTYAYRHKGYALTATVTQVTATRVKGSMRRVRGGSDLTEDLDWTRAEWESQVPVSAEFTPA